MSKITPKFNKNLPENWKSFFDQSSDEQFKNEHPIAYPALVFIGITALLLPCYLFYWIVTGLLGKTIDSPVVLIGFIGGFSIGTSLFNIIGAFLQQYLGHKFTAISMGGGLILCVISALLL